MAESLVGKIMNCRTWLGRRLRYSVMQRDKSTILSEECQDGRMNSGTVLGNRNRLASFRANPNERNRAANDFREA